MITKVSNTVSMLKSLWVEMFLNKTSKVSNIADGSVLSAVAYGTAKVAQKAIKDIAITEAQIFPTTATGDYLDKSAALFGVSPRKQAIGSSTYVRVYADPGTIYMQGTNFIANNGIRFESEASYTVDNSGYGYISVRSTSTGEITNVDANTITQVSPRPLGHIECTNEYCAIGGRDYEDDETFRSRIINYNNRLSENTTESFTQIFQDLDDRILKVMNVGLGEDGKTHIYLVTQNGSYFTDDELDTLLEQATPYFGFTEIDIQGDVVGIVLENAEWMYVGGDTGIDFRVELQPDCDIATVRKNIQIALTKYLDFRFWTPGGIVEWDDLLSVVKNADGVKYVPDEYFNPSYDEEVPLNQLPRIKAFRIRDLEGNVLFDAGSNLSNIFYPAGDVEEQSLTNSVTNQQFLTSFIVTTVRNVAVPSAYITIGNNVIVTDQNGQANILLENGTYDYILTKTGWDTQQSSFVVLNNPIQININDFNATPYNVTFIVYEGNAPMLGARISIQNQVLTTNSQGEATISLEPGTYSYTITMSGYTTINSAVTVENQDITVTERMFLEQMNVNFSVIDRQRSIYVPTVDIVVTDITQQTDEFGQAEVPLLIGTYDVTAYKQGYQTYNGQAIVTGNENENCVLIELNATPYDVRFTVIDDETGAAIPGATVQIQDQTYITDDSGIVIISLISGVFDYTVFKSGYMQVKNKVTVDQAATSVIVRLQEAYYTFRLFIRDIENGDYLQGMEVFINNRTIISNVNGMIETTLPNGEYDYVVRSSDYKEYRGTIEIKDQDLVETIYIQVRNSNLTFTVTDELTGEPLLGADVVLTDVGTQTVVTQGTTNAIGVVVLDAEAGSYSYTVSRQYYYDVTDTVTVERLVDQSINVVLKRRPGLKEIDVKEIIPNVTSETDIANGGASIGAGFSVTVTNTNDNTSQVLTTDENGAVFAEVVFGVDYEIRPTTQGFYQNETITHNWDPDETAPVVLSLTCSKQIEFRVKQDITSRPLQGVTILVTGMSDNQTVTTDEDGNASVYVSPVQLTYNASLANYNTITGTFTPTVDSTYIEVVMTFIQRQLTINVKASNPKETSANNCPVLIESTWIGTEAQQYDITGVTGTNGSFVTIGNSSGSIPPGTYKVTVGGDDSNYNEVSQEFTFPETNVVDLVVTRKTLTVTINAKEKFGTSGSEHNFAAGTVLRPTYEDNTSSGSDITLTVTSSFQKTMYAGYAEKFDVVPTGFYSSGALITVDWNDSMTINYPIVCTKVVPVYVKSDFYENYLEGASVIFTGAGVSQTGLTNASGYVNIYLVPLQMSYTISLQGYTTLSGDLTPQTSTTRLEYTLNVIRSPLTVNVTIQGSSNIPSGVPVRLVNQYDTSIVYSGNTDNSGKISFSDMPPGNYNWSVAADQANYEEASGIVYIPAENNTLNVQIEYKKSNSIIIVQEQIPGGSTYALSNIVLSYTSSVGNGTINLNSSGQGSFVAVLGVTYTFTVPNSSFYSNGSQTHSFTAVNQTWTMTVTCSQQITINVKSANYGTNISGASITYFNQTKSTDSSGNVTFYRSSLTKSYTVSKTNYSSLSGNITTSTTSPLNLTLAETSSSITITLKDYYQNAQQANANGCSVTLKNTRLSSISYSGTTNSNGQVTFGPMIAGTYTLTWGGGTSYWQSGSVTINMPTASYQNNAVRKTQSITSTWYFRIPTTGTSNHTFKVNSLYRPVVTTNGVVTTVTLGYNNGAYTQFTYTYIAGIQTSIQSNTTYFCTGTTITNTPYIVTPTYNFNNIPTTYYCCAKKAITVTVQSNRTSAAISGASVQMKGIDGSTSFSAVTQSQTTNSNGQVTIYVSGLINQYTTSATDYVTDTRTNNTTSNFTIVLNYITYTLTVTVKRLDNTSKVAVNCPVKISENNTSVAYNGTTNDSGVWTVTIYKGTYYWETGGGTTWGSDLETSYYPEHYRGETPGTSNRFVLSSNLNLTIFAWYVGGWWVLKDVVQNFSIPTGNSTSMETLPIWKVRNNNSLYSVDVAVSSSSFYDLHSLRFVPNINNSSNFTTIATTNSAQNYNFLYISQYIKSRDSEFLILEDNTILYKSLSDFSFSIKTQSVNRNNQHRLYLNEGSFVRNYNEGFALLTFLTSYSDYAQVFFYDSSFNYSSMKTISDTDDMYYWRRPSWLLDSNVLITQRYYRNLSSTWTDWVVFMSDNFDVITEKQGPLRDDIVAIYISKTLNGGSYKNSPFYVIISTESNVSQADIAFYYFNQGFYNDDYSFKSYQSNPSIFSTILSRYQANQYRSIRGIWANDSFTKILFILHRTVEDNNTLIEYWQKGMDGNFYRVENNIADPTGILIDLFSDESTITAMSRMFNIGTLEDYFNTYSFRTGNTLYSYDLVWND